jgi:hypothetical protein
MANVGENRMNPGKTKKLQMLVPVTVYKMNLMHSREKINGHP